MASDDSSIRKARSLIAGGPTLPAHPNEVTLVEPPGSGDDDSSTSRAWVTESLPILRRDHRYAISRELAHGGLGRVWLAHDRRLDRAVVVKELLGSGSDAMERFLREARITARLQHPAIVPVHDAGRWPDGVPFYAMKEVSGETLGDAIAGKRSLAERLALLPNLITVAEAIGYAHSQGVIHRDLKPANVIVGAFGETVVIDWGLAKELHERADHTEQIDAGTVAAPATADVPASHTLDGSIVGTPTYMPPEQARGERVDERADVYGLGAILYTLLSGKAPYEGESSARVLEAVVRAPPVPLGVRQPGVPQDLQSIVARAMSRDPAMRPSAREFAEDLKRFQTGQLVASHAYSLRELLRRWIARQRTAVTVATISIVALAALAVVSVQRIRAQRNVALERSRETEERNAELILLQARSAVDRDPTEALAWLKLRSPRAAGGSTARGIAVDAASRGVARHVLAGHDGTVWQVSWSPDGRHLASASADSTVRVWDLEAGTSRVLRGHTKETDAVVWTPDGARLYSSSDDTTLRVWDLATGSQTIVGRHEGAISDLAIFDGGRRAVTVSYDQTLRVWELGPGTSKAFHTEGHGTINGVAISPDGTWAATAGNERTVAIWDLATGASRLLVGHERTVRGVAISPDGRTVASASTDGRIILWDAASGARLRELTGHLGEVHGVAFSPDGQLLASTSQDQTVRLWDVARGDSRVLRGHAGPLYDLAFSPDGRRLASGGSDKRIRVWDVPGVDVRTVRAEGEARVIAVAIAGQGRVLFAAEGGRAELVDGTTGERRIVSLGATPSEHVAWSEDGTRVAVLGSDRTVTVIDARDGERWQLPSAGAELPKSLSLSRDGSLVLIADNDRTVRLWTPATGERRTIAGFVETLSTPMLTVDGATMILPVGTSIWLVPLAGGSRRELAGHTGWIRRVVSSPDGTRLASASNDQSVRVWDLRSGTSVVLRGHDAVVASVAFSPDGSRLASGSSDRTIRLWDLTTGEDRTFSGHAGDVLALAFSPDGSHLASGSSDHTARVWDLVTGASRVLDGHAGGVDQLAFLADGRLLSGSRDGTARLWPIAADDDVPTDSDAFRIWLDRATDARVR